MKANRLLVSAIAAAAAFSACSSSTGPAEVENVLLEKWSGPYGGVPPFDRVEVADIAAGLEQGMASALEEMEAIACADGPGDLR